MSEGNRREGRLHSFKQRALNSEKKKDNIDTILIYLPANGEKTCKMQKPKFTFDVQEGRQLTFSLLESEMGGREGEGRLASWPFFKRLELASKPRATEGEEGRDCVVYRSPTTGSRSRYR